MGKGKAIAFAVAILLDSGPASAMSRAVHARVRVDGSSTVYPITEAVAEEFLKLKKGRVRVTVGVSGTGGGFKKFCRGETDVQDASRPISAEEMKACLSKGIKYFELPIGYDAMAVVVNPGNDWAKNITVADLKKIWAPEAQGKINNWRQVRPEWPDLELKLFGAGSDSGTFDYFTEAINGKAKQSRGDYTASEDDNTLVQGIASSKGALGYIPFAYYESNAKKIKALPVDGGPKAPKKGPILPTAQTVEDGSYFPLSRPLFIYVSEAALKRPEVHEFVQFFLDKAPSLVAEVKYVPLPKATYETVRAALTNGRIGTAFGGHPELGQKVDDFMKAPTTLEPKQKPSE